MRHEMTWISAVALLLPTPGLAADAPAPLAPVHRLTESEVDRVLDAAAAKREAAGGTDEKIGGARPQIHGEVGVGIGTGGYRSAYGTAIVPLDDGRAIISFDATDLGSGSHTDGYRPER